MKTIFPILVCALCLLADGRGRGQDVDVLTRELLQKKLLEMMHAGTGKAGAVEIPERDKAQFDALTKPFLFIQGKFPEDALRQELRDGEMIMEKLCGGAVLPTVMIVGKDLNARNKLDREMLVVLVRLHRELLAQLAEHYQPEATAPGQGGEGNPRGSEADSKQ